MCDCISYNRPEPDQKTPSVTLTLPAWSLAERESVDVDACIAEQITSLWDAGILTFSCCCGHNGKYPRHVLVGKENAFQAKAHLADRFDHPLVVQYWGMVTA